MAGDSCLSLFPDETTPDGEMWQEIFSHVTNIDGLVRASWGLNQYNRDLNLFLVGKLTRHLSEIGTDIVHFAEDLACENCRLGELQPA